LIRDSSTSSVLDRIIPGSSREIRAFGQLVEEADYSSPGKIRAKKNPAIRWILGK